MKARPSKAQAAAWLKQRTDEAIAAFTPQSIAGPHLIQLDGLTTWVQSLLLMCSRRAGKSILCVGLCCLTALKTANVYCLYLSLTADQSAPRYSECQALLRKYGIPFKPNEVDQSVTLNNGSRIRFTGTDDRRRIQNLLGDQLASGIVIIDEAQSDPGLLEWLLKEILDPMVSETTADKPTPGRIVVSGVVPESEAGYFWKLWTENYDEATAKEKPGAAWRCMAWGRADNPHEHDFRKHLDAYLHKFKLSEDDPIVQRNWYGRRVFDRNVTAYRYSFQHCSYKPLAPSWMHEWRSPFGPHGPLGTLRAAAIPAGVTEFAFGIDPASRRDCCAIVAWGWGSMSPDVWQLAEFVTEPGSGIRQDQWIEVLLFLRDKYPNVIGIKRDAGSAAEDIILADYKLRIEAVTKGPGSVKERVERTAALAGQRRLHAIAGSQLETQLKTVRWDPVARERGKWVLLSTIPNDVTDAADYGLEPYYNAFTEKAPPESMEAMHTRLFREAMRPVAPTFGYEEDPGLVQLLGEHGPPS